MRGIRDSLAAQSSALPVAKMMSIVEAWDAKRRQRTAATTALELKINLSARNGSEERARSAHRLIERWCLNPFKARRLEADRSRYKLSVVESDAAPLDLLVQRLIEGMHRVATERSCDMEVLVRHRSTGRIWS
mgnify:CR=1 FL=1